MNKNIPILIDLDGVIRLGNRLAGGALELFNFVNQNKIPSCIITNSTRNTSGEVIKFLNDNGINFKINAMTTVDATIEYIKEKKLRVSVYCIQSVQKEFEAYIDNRNPDAVIIGDLGEGWSYPILNDIFRKVYDGAEIIAMQKNKFWQPDGKSLALDAGAFVAAIEYATGKKSTLIGKPSPFYFQAALKILGFKETNPFYMVGDDIENDIGGAQSIGGTGILVYTGKTKFPLSSDMEVHPHFEVQNLFSVLEMLDGIFVKN